MAAEGWDLTEFVIARIWAYGHRSSFLRQTALTGSCVVFLGNVFLFLSRISNVWWKRSEKSGKYIQLFRERLSEEMCTRQFRKIIWDMINTLFPDDCSCRTYFRCFPLALENTFTWPFVPILSNFFEEQRTQNHPQCLSGLSRALFPTTFLEIAVYDCCHLGHLDKVVQSEYRKITIHSKKAGCGPISSS